MESVKLCPLLLLLTLASGIHYEPNWKSLDTRPLPAWYDEVKLGIFLHWGVFSVPSISSEWFWYRWKHDHNHEVLNFLKKNYRPDFTYADFAPQLTAEFFDANQWAKIIESSGAGYMVFTSKHDEGFANWPSNRSFNWNSMDVGPKRDIVGELEKAIRGTTSLRFGIYHGLYEWYNPLAMIDTENNYTTQYFVNQKTLPDLYELVNTYKPDILWSDGGWIGYISSYFWKAPEFVAWLYNDSPIKDTVITNDRWGTDTACKHGGYLTCNDRYQPGKAQKRKWENSMTIDKASYGFRRNAHLEDYLTTQEIIATFVETVSCGGNMLMNVGPTKEGTIRPIFESRLRDMGSWLSVNGEAIRSTRPWSTQNDTLTSKVWYTMKNMTVYAIVLEWPTTDILSLGAPEAQSGTTVSLLGYTGGNFTWTSRPSGGIDITIPPIPVTQIPCQWAWAFKLSGLVNISD